MAPRINRPTLVNESMKASTQACNVPKNKVAFARHLDKAEARKWNDTFWENQPIECSHLASDPIWTVK
jgi:hypothetical protein